MNEAKLIDKILDDENIERAYRQVYANKGVSGIDGVTVYELKEYLEKNWTDIKQAFLAEPTGLNLSKGLRYQSPTEESRNSVYRP